MNAVTQGRWIVAVVLALGAGAVVGYLAHAPTPAAGAVAATTDAAALAELQARLNRLEAREGAGASRSARAAPLPEAAAPMPTPAQHLAEMQAAEHRMQAALDATFAGSTRAAPDDRAAQQVDAAFAAGEVLHASALPRSKEVECRATLCLIRAQFDAGQDSADWVDRLLLEMGAALPGATVVPLPQPDGSVEVRIYASRPGDATPLEIAQAHGGR
jgi:hypothetical protein